MIANTLISSNEEQNYHFEGTNKKSTCLYEKIIEKTNLYRFSINESDDSDDNLPLIQLVEKRNNKKSNNKNNILNIIMYLDTRYIDIYITILIILYNII